MPFAIFLTIEKAGKSVIFTSAPRLCEKIRDASLVFPSTVSIPRTSEAIEVPVAVPQINSIVGVPESTVKQVYPESAEPFASVPLTRVMEVLEVVIGVAKDVSKIAGALGIVEAYIYPR